MAGIGMTKVDAVSDMLMSVGQSRVTGLDTGGPSDAGEAEYILDRVMREYVRLGKHDSCIRRHVGLTANGSGEVDLSTAAPQALHIQGSGKYARRGFSIQGTKVYDDLAAGTAVFAATESVTVDIFELPSSNSTAAFENLDPGFKEMIVAEAMIRYRRMKKPDALVDSMLVRQKNALEFNRQELIPNKTESVPGVVYGSVQSQNLAQQIPGPQ